MPGVGPTVLITGVSGNLGLRVLSELADFQVVGVDLHPPRADRPLHFVSLDLGLESSCRELLLLLREHRPLAVIHLAFVLDPVRTGVLDPDRMWQINVAGTARVMEAVAEANRDETIVGKFIFLGSVSAYGSSLPNAVTEDAPLKAHTLPYAIHKMEADKVVQQRAPALRGCSVYLLRPHIIAGASMDNYMVGAFRGTPNGKSARAERMRKRGRRLPCLLPTGSRYLNHRIQFVHVDDMARLLAFIVRRVEPEPQRITILNVAGSGEPLTFRRCLQLANANLRRVPGKWIFGLVLELLWKAKISAIPPQAAPYMLGEYVMNTDRLRRFLGSEYEQVIRHTVEDAFADSFAQVSLAADAVTAR